MLAYARFQTIQFNAECEEQRQLFDEHHRAVCILCVSHMSIISISCALSFRNLVLGYECGRAFPAGKGLVSPSRGAINLMFCQFRRSVETRQRYGWLRMVFTRCPSGELQFGALREVVARER